MIARLYRLFHAKHNNLWNYGCRFYLILEIRSFSVMAVSLAYSNSCFENQLWICSLFVVFWLMYWLNVSYPSFNGSFLSLISNTKFFKSKFESQIKMHFFNFHFHHSKSQSQYQITISPFRQWLDRIRYNIVFTFNLKFTSKDDRLWNIFFN